MTGKRITLCNWQEMCNLVKEYNDRDEHVKLVPISWEGWQKKDRKSKGLIGEIDKDKVVHIVFEIEKYD